jgi:Uncharacterised nucleotidyltransferase
VSKIPRHIAAALEALKFRGARPEMLRTLSDSEWQDLLSLSDPMHLTLSLGKICGDYLPGWVRERIGHNVSDNAKRFERIKGAYSEMAVALRDVGAEHLVLKGFAQSPDYVEDPRLRMQSDIDVFCPLESIFRSRDALSEIGYEPKQGLEHHPDDHLAPMMRKTDWEWRGNAFDPEMPLSVELHFRFWNQTTTRLNPKGLDRFWVRRIERRVEGVNLPTLSRVDGLGYSALHVFHHLQMGYLIPYHVYELAWFLENNADDEQFWKDWRDLHDDSLRRLEVVCFRLATEWFACRLPNEVAKEIDCLPNSIQQWFLKYADSPLNALINPNKDALWLHLSLLESRHAKILVFCESLLPVRVPPTKAVGRWSLRTYAKFLRHAASRLGYHLRILPLTLWGGLRWWWST